MGEGDRVAKKSIGRDVVFGDSGKGRSDGDLRSRLCRIRPCKAFCFAGIHTILLEDRKDFADRAKETGAQEIICRPFDKAIRDLTEEANTAYVVMTRGHAYDEKCLLEIAKKESYYVGMMGSKTRSAMMREELRLAGVSAEWINRLHAPIGLSIGAQTPEEIAVAVLAQILSERSRVGNPLRAGYEVFRQALTCLKEGERICSCHNFGETGLGAKKGRHPFHRGRIRTVFLERSAEANWKQTSCRQRWK